MKRALQPKKTRDVIHDIFYEASKHIDDEYWKNFFIDLSKGKLSRKIHVDGKHVSHNSKRMKFSYCYENKSSEDVAMELRKIISNTMCIYSDLDMSNEQEGLALIVDEFKDAKTEDDFKKMKTRKMKDHLITNFVLSQKAQHKLTWEKARIAYETINNALFNYRTHKSDTIIMMNGEIESIEDIVISPTEITNKRFLCCTDNDDDKPVVKKISLEKEWTKTCNAISKRARVLLCDVGDEELGIKKKTSRNKKAVLTNSAVATEETNQTETQEETITPDEENELDEQSSSESESESEEEN